MCRIREKREGVTYKSEAGLDDDIRRIQPDSPGKRWTKVPRRWRMIVWSHSLAFANIVASVLALAVQSTYDQIVARRRATTSPFWMAITSPSPSSVQGSSLSGTLATSATL